MAIAAIAALQQWPTFFPSSFFQPPLIFSCDIQTAMSIDDALIEKLYSPLAGRLRHGLGLCQWRVALECLNGSVAFYVGAVAFEIAGKGMNDGIFVTMLRALVWLLIMDRVRRLARRQAASSIGMSSARTRERLFRIVLVGVLPLSLCYVAGWSNLLYSASLALLVCHLYFKAADMPPPMPKGRLAFLRA